MTDKRWNQVETLFRQALEREPHDRGTFLGKYVWETKRFVERSNRSLHTPKTPGASWNLAKAWLHREMTNG